MHYLPPTIGNLDGPTREQLAAEQVVLSERLARAVIEAGLGPRPGTAPTAPPLEAPPDRLVRKVVTVGCALALLATVGCRGDDRADSPLPTQVSSYGPAAGCDSSFPARMTVADSLRIFVVACWSAGRRTARITNTSSAVLVLAPQQGSPPVRWTDRSDRTNALLVTGSIVKLGADNAGRFVLGPKATVVATSSGPDGPRLVAQPSRASAVSIAATVATNMLENRLRGPIGSALGSARSCAAAVGNVVDDLVGNAREEDFFNAFLQLPTCVSLLELVGIRPSGPGARTVFLLSSVFVPGFELLLKGIGSLFDLG